MNTEMKGDLVDRIFDLLLSNEKTKSALIQQSADFDQTVDELKETIRHEMGGERLYVRSRRSQREIKMKVLGLFNGRNATEVARKLGIGRATVYRLIKQPGKI